MIASDSRVPRRASSAVGRRGELFVSVPKKIVPDSASNDGVLQMELVEGPKKNLCSPQLSLMTIGGSSGSGLGPTSYFQMIFPVFGSRAATKPRPLHPLKPGNA